ncbi:unnamed protein product [Larinioides sclopetarius]|uniref:Uncharacterized protein n=1 Tax=Larinioides sclopetarius TaxID=280406 RepID=A0AAV1YUV8_9ARAC
MAKFDMNDGLVALFEDFMLRNEYEEALNVICDCYTIAPTSFVISEIIFKIMMTCDSKLCSKALDYLEQSLRLMPTDDDHKYVFIEGLKDKTGQFGDVWSAFHHFVLSSLHHRKISDGYTDILPDNLQEYVNYPNCDYLVQIYVHAFMSGPFKSTVIVSHPEEKFSALVKWINVFYKCNAEIDDLLKNLHLLLDYIFELELSDDPKIPKCAAIHKAPVSKYILILLSCCKDVFHLENQQKFFILTESPYLILKICEQRLDDMLGKRTVPQNSVLTLKSIVEDYFFDQREQKIPKEEKSPRKSKKGRKSTTPSKNYTFAKLKAGKKHKGDTDFHICCRSNRFDNLLEAMYADKSKDINAKNCLGMTPLHEACLVGSYLCCKFLIEESGVRKVDFRATDNEGRTPLHFAVYTKALDVVNLLIKRGGSDLVKYRDNMGKKPIDYCESEEIRKILQDTQLHLEPSDDESQKNSDSEQQKLPTLKNSENLPLYLRTLRSLIGTYCDIYDIPKDENDGKVELLSHSDEECCHYKAPAERTLCADDFSTLATIVKNIKKLAACVKCISTDVNMKRELRGLEFLALSFV